MQISTYLTPDSVLFLTESDKSQILETMCRHAADMNMVPGLDQFRTAILEREQIMSTGIGLQVAVPHAKIPGIADFFVLIGVTREAVNWDSIDKQPVRLVFMIGGPADRQSDYLKILSKITLVIKNAGRREALLKAPDAQAILAEFSEL